MVAATGWQAFHPSLEETDDGVYDTHHVEQADHSQTGGGWLDANGTLRSIYRQANWKWEDR